MAHLYGLTEDEFKHILSTFPLVDQRVKDDALQAFRDLAPPEGDPEVVRLLRGGESERVEFKSSMRVPVDGSAPSKELTATLEGVIIKEIAAFLNAEGGTLLLDEIGELSLPLQVKLLRVLQEREITRVGSRKAIKVDVRVIAATHVDLMQAIRERRFREDLYYRLNIALVPLPPLRQRRQDIPVLADHFLSLYARRLGRPAEMALPGEVEQEFQLLDHAAF